MINNALNALINFLTNVVTYLLDGFLFVLKSTLYLIYDGVLTVIQAAILAIDFGSLGVSFVLQWSGLPSQSIYLLNQWGLPQCLIIISSAMGIRLLLNLIPAAFTRI